MITNKRHFIYWKICFYIVLVSAVLYGETKQKYSRSIHAYNLPDITLQNQANKNVNLSDLIKQKKIIILDFIYATCKTVCPILSANFANFQYRIGNGPDNLQLISITIDPEHDNTSVTKKYLERYRAGVGWDFLSGDPNNILNLIKIFSVYTEERMGYYPIVFIYSPKDKYWIQLEGPMTTAELISEYKEVLDK